MAMKFGGGGAKLVVQKFPGLEVRNQIGKAAANALSERKWEVVTICDCVCIVLSPLSRGKTICKTNWEQENPFQTTESSFQRKKSAFPKCCTVKTINELNGAEFFQGQLAKLSVFRMGEGKRANMRVNQTHFRFFFFVNTKEHN